MKGILAGQRPETHLISELTHNPLGHLIGLFRGQEEVLILLQSSLQIPSTHFSWLFKLPFFKTEFHFVFTCQKILSTSSVRTKVWSWGFHTPLKSSANLGIFFTLYLPVYRRASVRSVCRTTFIVGRQNLHREKNSSEFFHYDFINIFKDSNLKE